VQISAAGVQTSGIWCKFQELAYKFQELGCKCQERANKLQELGCKLHELGSKFQELAYKCQDLDKAISESSEGSKGNEGNRPGYQREAIIRFYLVTAARVSDLPSSGD
jgi:hypothetical protein